LYSLYWQIAGNFPLEQWWSTFWFTDIHTDFLSLYF